MASEASAMDETGGVHEPLYMTELLYLRQGGWALRAAKAPTSGERLQKSV